MRKTHAIYSKKWVIIHRNHNRINGEFILCVFAFLTATNDKMMMIELEKNRIK